MTNENTKTVKTVEAANNTTVIDINAAPDTTGKELIVADNLMPTTGLEAQVPSWMGDKEVDELTGKASVFFDGIMANPTNLDHQTAIYKLGDDGNKAMIPHCNLFEKKMIEVMNLQKEGDPITNGLLGVKAALDTINPTILAKTEISERVAVFFKKNRLPKADEIQQWVYERRETVATTIAGIKKGLLASADGLVEDLEEIKQIYDGLVEAQQMIERDIFFAQLVHQKLLPATESVNDQMQRAALEDNLAALTQVVNALQSEEAANMVFFANAQNYAKQNQMQLFNIKRRVPMLERSVLANLGLKAAMANLKDSMRATDALTGAIGDTLADAASAGRQIGVEMTEARGKAIIDLDKLQSAIGDIEGMYQEQAVANKEVIALGMETSKELTKVVARVKSRVEGGHESMRTK